MMKKMWMLSIMLLGMSLVVPWAISNTFAQVLTKADCQAIVAAAEVQANEEDSIFRPGAKTKMQIACVDRDGKILAFTSMPDAWGGSIDIARAKANTARAFSSNENALTSRDIGDLSTDFGPLFEIGNSNQAKSVKGNAKTGGKVGGIIQFPGGIPLYKDSTLVGAIGVSGDGVDQDEDVAEAGACGFQPPNAIRSDTVLGLVFTLGGPQFTFPASCP